MVLGGDTKDGQPLGFVAERVGFEPTRDKSSITIPAITLLVRKGIHECGNELSEKERGLPMESEYISFIPFELRVKRESLEELMEQKVAGKGYTGMMITVDDVDDIKLLIQQYMGMSTKG